MSTNKSTVSKPVTKTMLALQVDEPPAKFDIIQFDSIQTAKSRLQRKFRSMGYKWSTTTNGETIEVTREA